MYACPNSSESGSDSEFVREAVVSGACSGGGFFVPPTERKWKRHEQSNRSTPLPGNPPACMFATPVSLLYRLRRTDEVAAWGRFVDLYTPLLYNWAQKLGEQDSDSGDLVQDVFLILWRKLPEFEYDSGRSFHAWLRTIFLNRYRSRLRQRYTINGDSSGLTGVDCSVSDFSEKLAQEEDTRFLIRQAFRLIEGEFSALQQHVFRAYVLEEQPPEKVAEAMGLSPGTVYGIKSKILSRLRQELHQILE